MIKHEGTEAQARVLDWGYRIGFIDQVTKTLEGEHTDCRWVYVRDGRGKCMHCGDCDNSGVPAKFDLEVDASN
jgi:hypothetical protein